MQFLFTHEEGKLCKELKKPTNILYNIENGHKSSLSFF